MPPRKHEAIARHVPLNGNKAGLTRCLIGCCHRRRRFTQAVGLFVTKLKLSGANYGDDLIPRRTVLRFFVSRGTLCTWRDFDASIDNGAVGSNAIEPGGPKLPAIKFHRAGI